MIHDTKFKNLLKKQNILKNITVLVSSMVLTLWMIPYAQAIGEKGLDAFFFLSIFPLGAMFAYFAFRYSDTHIDSTEHRILADLSTFIFLLIICTSVAFAVVLTAIAMPPLKFPVIVLAVLLIAGCLMYDFWNLYCNLMRK
ncbi:MAG: hypothetical protein WC882_04220 [Candidatus Gracilibacteria bacterium]